MATLTGSTVEYTATAAVSGAISGDPVEFTAIPASYLPGEVVTLTLNPPNGTVASVVLTGKTPAPALVGTLTTRSFVAPIFEADTVMTLTTTDTVGAASSIKVTVLAALERVNIGGTWVRAYEVIITPGGTSNVFDAATYDNSKFN